jgi:hypothetical protein
MWAALTAMVAGSAAQAAAQASIRIDEVIAFK